MTKWAEVESRRISDDYKTFYMVRDGFVSRLAVFCRLFSADDPKAELAKMAMELSDLLNPPEYETVEEHEKWLFEWQDKYFALSDQDLLSVSTFLANCPCSSKNQEN